MNIAAVDIYQYALPLSQPLTIRGQAITKREGLILHLMSEKGEEGFGEIAPLTNFSRETLSESIAQLQSLKEKLMCEVIPKNLEALDGKLESWLNHFSFLPSVQFGVESAVLNLLANSKNIPLHQLISKTVNHQVRITGLLHGSHDQVTQQAKELLAQGFTKLKLKVGGNVDDAVKKVQAVNDVVYGKALLHLDANQAWNLDDAICFGNTIGSAAISYIEEPLSNLDGIPEFFEKTLIPVALDESLNHLTFDDVKSISGVETLVLKPTILGSIDKMGQVIKQAENYALNTMISSSFESSLGIWTLASLAGSLTHNHPAGLDTLKWFKEDILKASMPVNKGAIKLHDQSIRSNDINFDVLRKLE